MILFFHEFESDNPEEICKLCREERKTAQPLCPFREGLRLELEEETLP